MNYVISPGCTGPNGETLALAFQAPGYVVVQDASQVTMDLLWFTVYDAALGGFALVSASSVAGGQPRAVTLIYISGGKLLSMPFKKTGFNGWNTWRVAPSGNALAVIPLGNNCTMNVVGNGPYPPGTPVQATNITSGGAPNEVWTFNAFGTETYPWPYTFAPECASGTLLSANPLDAGGQLTIETPSAAGGTAGNEQLWSASYYIDGVTPVGATFVNLELTMQMRTTPGGGAVFPVDMTQLDEWSAWRVGGAPDAGASAVHSGGDDDLTLNVSGGGPYDPGNPVITYPWQGGAENEQWTVTSVPQNVTLDAAVTDEEFDAQAERLTRGAEGPSDAD